MSSRASSPDGRWSRTGDLLRKAGRIGAFAAMHPRRAGRVLSDATDRDGERRFQGAMNLLTGLDLDLRLERDGLVWVLPPSDEGIATSLYRSGAYSETEWRAILEFIRKRRPGKDWFVDIGAHVGTTTIPVARAGLKVLALEPVPSTARYLRTNVAQNELSASVTIVEAAISDEEEVLIAVSTSPGLSEVIKSSDEDPAYAKLPAYSVGRSSPHSKTVAVPGVGLDEVIARHEIPVESIALVWGDTQGSEIALVTSGRSLWQTGVPLFIEFWPPGLEKHGGVQRLIDEARGHFSEFIESGNLVDGDWMAQPLIDLHALAARPSASANVLLLP